LILCGQGLGVGEKFWISIWGSAYGESTSVPPAFMSFSTPEHDLALDSPFNAQHLMNNAPHYSANLVRFPTLPDANERPLFYVGVYAAIGLGTASITVLSAVTQYTGALRASRRLFKQLLVAVVRATFRWHDVTPQGRMLNRFSKVRKEWSLKEEKELKSVSGY
jgi:ABC-type multidrug transport system fused ATPase/permease subunit